MGRSHHIWWAGARADGTLLKTMFDAAISAALPEKIVSRHLPTPPKGRTIVVGAGKASAGMARAVEDHWPGLIAGLVITRYGHAVPCRRIKMGAFKQTTRKSHRFVSNPIARNAFRRIPTSRSQPVGNG